MGPADEDLLPEQLLRLLNLYEAPVAFLSERKIAALLTYGVGSLETKLLEAPSLEMLSSMDGQLPDEVEVDDGDNVIMLLTSGTTGHPKSVMTTNRMLLSVSRGKWRDGAAKTGGPMIYFGSPAWISYSATCLISMGSSICLTLGQAYVKDVYFDLVLRHKPSLLFFWPEVVVDFVGLAAETQEQIASFVTGLTYGGARTPAAALLKMVRALPNTEITQGYGASEAMTLSVLSPQDHAAVRCDQPEEAALRRLSSAGKCVATIRIVDQENKPVPVGEVGYVHVLPGPTPTFEGYYNNEKATKEKFSEDGWLILGDLGRQDEDGYLYIEGRDSETIVLLSGDNVYPNEVEAVIAELPGVVEVAVVKVVNGESEGAISEVGAFVRIVPGSGVTQEYVRQQCEKGLGQEWTRPTHIFLRTEKLPRNRNGKCLKSQLSQWASAAARGGPSFESKCRGA